MSDFLDPKKGSRPSSDGYEVYWEWDENCGRVYRSTQLGEHVWTPGIMHLNALLTAILIENQIQLEEQILRRREENDKA